MELASEIDLAPRQNFETAVQHACRNVPIVSGTQTIEDVREKLQRSSYESVSHIAVCDRGEFQGILRIEDVFTAAPDDRVELIMDHDAPKVAPGVDQEVAVWHAVRNKEAALSVVDHNGQFVGLILPNQLLAVLLSEHEEDLSRVAGFIKSTSTIREASEEPVKRRFLHRLPWLVLGLVGSLLAADFVGCFETQLQQKVMLAFFIPGIVYLADAVGTQTETIVVRGLSIGVEFRKMLLRELVAGLVIGIALSALAGPLIWWRWQDAEITICVTLSILAACSTATIIAVTLPWLFSRFRLDPAFGTGPLATVIQDLLSILIYFYIATHVIH